MKKILGNFMWESYVSSAREVQLLRGSLGRKVELEILKCVDGFGIATVGKIMMIRQEGMSMQCVRGPGVNMKVGCCWRVALLQISSHSYKSDSLKSSISGAGMKHGLSRFKLLPWSGWLLAHITLPEHRTVHGCTSQTDCMDPQDEA